MTNYEKISYNFVYLTSHRNTAVDTHVGVEDGEVMGPVERKLGEYGELHGLVVGRFGEASEDVHNLIHAMAESRVSGLDLRSQPGAMEREELSIVVGQLRRRLSVAVIRATANCLLSRLTFMGEEPRGANKRRQWRDREEI